MFEELKDLAAEMLRCYRSGVAVAEDQLVTMIRHIQTAEERVERRLGDDREAKAIWPPAQPAEPAGEAVSVPQPPLPESASPLLAEQSEQSDTTAETPSS